MIYPRFDQLLRDLATANATSPGVPARPVSAMARGYVRMEFAQALADTYCTDFPPATGEVIFNQAWEDAQDHGYQAVEERYITLIGFASRLRDAIC